MKHATFLFSCALLTAAASVHAQATDVTFFRTNIHGQTSATAADYLGSYLAAGISVTDGNDYGTATLTLPDGTTSYPLAHNWTQYNLGSPVYGSATELEAAFPHGDYVFSLAAGNLSASALALTDSEDRWPAEVPLAQEYDALQHAVAGQALTIHVAGYTPGPGTNDNLSFYVLRDNTSNAGVLDGRGTSDAFSFDIAPNVLEAGHDYTLLLHYSSRFTIPNAGFGGATAYDAYDQFTTVEFVVAPVPEPASLAVLSLGAFGTMRRRRR